MTKEAMQQALDVLRHCLEHPDAEDAIAALEAAIAQPVQPSAVMQEPVAGDVQAKYNELIYAVGMKWPGESRHETALRYIRQRETKNRDVPSTAIAAGGKP